MHLGTLYMHVGPEVVSVTCVCVCCVQEKKKKYEPPLPTRVGKKRRLRGPEAANKLPPGEPATSHTRLTT